MGVRKLNISVILAFALIACSCTKENMQKEIVQIEQSDAPIYFSMPNPETPGTRANIYTPDNLTTHSTLGGNFSVSAYVSGTDTKYIDNARVWYFADFTEWTFSEYGAVKLYNCYWPKSGNLDFFAYMPKKDDLNNSVISDLSYNTADGPSFNCTLPMTNAGQDNKHEFIYAVTAGQNMQNQEGSTVIGDVSKGEREEIKAVKLEFKHPFAIVYLKLKRGYRMTLNEISFNGLKYKGSYKHNSGWDLNDDNGNLVISIGKRIPQDINYGNVFAGPFLVLPQDLTNIKMGIKGVRANENNSNLDVSDKSISTSEVTKWEAGKAYTYSLDLGDNAEEVLFEIVVEPWDRVGYKHIIGVE